MFACGLLRWDCADYFLGAIPTAIQFNMEWLRRLLAIQVVESNGELVKTTHYSFTLTHKSGNQFYTSTSTVNDGRLKRVYSFITTKKSRSRYADAFDWALDQFLHMGFTESNYFDEYIPYNTMV